MPSKSKTNKAREIGMRLVETCATCSHGSINVFRRESLWDDDHDFCHMHRNGIELSPLTCCNDYLRRSKLISTLLTGNRHAGLPIENTRNLRWAVCHNCGWEDWDVLTLSNYIDCDSNQLKYGTFCPKCQGNIRIVP